MGIRSCKNDDETKEQQREEPLIVESVYKTKPHTRDNSADIYKTRPPCWYGHKCSDPCHKGGNCVFK